MDGGDQFLVDRNYKGQKDKKNYFSLKPPVYTELNVNPMKHFSCISTVLFLKPGFAL